MKIINKRYRIVSLIESDSLGEVYRAVDLMNRDRHVRLKLFTKEYSKSDRIQRYIDDFYKWTTIRHPNVLEAYGFEMLRSVDNKTAMRHQYFYTSEYYDPEQLVSYKDLRRDEIYPAIFDLCRAVQYLHFRGMVYGYLNFDNVLFLRSGKTLTVKLNDFAYISHYKDLSVYSARQLNAFMAPESIWYEHFNTGADMYSIGVLVYLIYYQGSAERDTVDRLDEIIGVNPLTMILKKVTNQVAENRYKSMNAFVEDLSRQLRYKYSFTDHDAYNRIHYRTGLIGNRKIVDAIMSDARTRVFERKGSVGICLSGDPGTGKSRVLHELKHLMEMEGIEVFSQELLNRVSEPFSGLKPLLSRIIFNEKLSWELIQKYGPELVKLFPELMTRWDVHPTPMLSEEHEYLKMANRIFNFLSEFGSDRPFVLMIDNAELLSAFENTVIDFLCTVQKEVPVFIICSYKPGVHEDWHENTGIGHFQMNAFTYDEGAQFIQRMLGTKMTSIELSAMLMKTFEGNARRIEEAIRMLFLEKRIYVSEMRKWEIDLPEDMNVLGESSRSDMWMDSAIGTLTFVERPVLEAISIFREPVGTIILDRMFEMHTLISIGKVLADLVNKGILVQKLGDWGYSYDFASPAFRMKILHEIRTKDKIGYHSLSADILEDFYKDQGRHMSDQLIYHLIESGQTSRAVKYCMLAAEEMTKFNIYSQAIEFYERAIDLIDEDRSPQRMAELLILSGKLHRLTGKTVKAETFFGKAIRVAEAAGDTRAWIDATINLSDISITRGSQERAAAELQTCIEKSEQIGYIEGELGAARLMMKVSPGSEAYERIQDKLPMYIDKSVQADMPYYTGCFYNDLGVHMIRKGQLHEAKGYFEISIENLRNCDSKDEIASVYNNIGVLYGNGFGKAEIGRQYFVKALSIINDLNILDGRPVYLLNIGESYLREDRFEDAISYLNKAVRAAEEIDSRVDIYSILPLLCETYVRMNDYERAYGIIKKMGTGSLDEQRKKKNLYANYFVNAAYYMRIKNFEKAEQLLIQYRETAPASESIKATILDILMFRVSWHKANFLKLSKTVDFHDLEVLSGRSENFQAAQAFRNLVLDLSLELVNGKKFIQVQRLLGLDDQMRAYYDTEHLACKRSVLEAMMVDKRTTRLLSILKSARMQLCDEWRWVTFKLLADEYYYEGDTYLALTNYLMALDVIKTLTFGIPEIHRENYLLYDESKIELKARINDIRRKIEITGASDEMLLMHELETLSVDDYFDLSAIQSLYSNEGFLKKIHEIYKEKFSVSLSTLGDLVGHMQHDERINIRNVLIHCIQVAVANSGCVFITDEAMRNVDVIASDDDFIRPDITRLVSQLGLDREGLLISGFENDGLKYLLRQHQKALMLIPIYMNAQADRPSRRAGDDRDSKLFGYLYLESYQVFNRFNREIFSRIHQLTNMLSVMIDNFNIKKISSIDELTGVYLRKYFEERFGILLNKARQSGDTLSVIMCDIDKFKTINDRYGHRKGDDILKQIGQILKTSLRETDLVGRYGGEEFVIILTKADEDEAFLVSEKIRRNIESNLSLNEDEPITLSLGVSTYPDHGLSEEELIEKADQALYHSKNSGRNRTTLWNAHIGEEKSRFDKLAGILTGNISNDTRNIQAMVDILEHLKTEDSIESKIFSVLTTLLDITQATSGVILEIDDGEVTHVYAREKGYDDWQPVELDMDMIEMYMDRDFGDYFINWNEVSQMSSLGGKPNWKSMIVMPLKEHGKPCGMIMLSVPISVREFDFSAYNFVSSISGVVVKLLRETKDREGE